MRRFQIIILVLVSLLLHSSGTCFSQIHKYGGTLIFGSMGSPLNLDPGVIMDSESKQVACAIFETLVRFDARRNKYIPVLATSWKVSSDRKTYIFYLRRNVKFHDGTTFGAGAVKFSWERQMNGNHPFHNPSYGRFKFYRSLWGGYPGNIRDIDILDDNTVRVELYSRSYSFLKEIASLQFAIVSPKAVYDYRNDFTRNPVGTGPFRFVEWRPWQRIVLEANRKYWKGRPYLDRVIFEPAPGEKSRKRHMERRRIDIMENPTTDFIYNIEVKKRYPSLKTFTYPGTNFSCLAINCQKPPFNNPLIRNGLNYAIDKKRILRDINENMYVAVSPYRYLWDVLVEGSSFPLNHDQARRCFARAGYPSGFQVEIWYPKTSQPYLVSPERVARGVAQSLREVGLKVRLQNKQWETYLEELSCGKYDLAITGYTGMNYDPDQYFEIEWDRNNTVIGGTNMTFYRNDRIHSLLTACRFEPSRRERAEKYAQIQKILTEDTPMVPLFYNRTVAVMNQNIYGFSVDMQGLIDFSRIWIK